MTGVLVTDQRLAEHVRRLAEEHPPLSPESVDRTVRDPVAVRARFGDVIEYMARVELEVERNVLELLVLLPRVGETDRLFFQDVWGPQEVQHGAILDQFQQDLGMAASCPVLGAPGVQVRVLGALAHLPAVQDVVRLLYYLTGAATERSAMIAYTRMHDGLVEMGERVVAASVIAPIRQQEPGHFAYYSLAARSMLQSGALAPWQLHLARFLRSRTFGIVGAHTPEQVAGAGGVIVGIGLQDQVAAYARDIARVEAQLLWADRQGAHVPGYVLAALRGSVDAYHDRLRATGRRADGGTASPSTAGTDRAAA